MKNQNKKPKMSTILAAVLLGAYSFGPYAYAEIQEKRGISAAELLNIIPDLKITQSGLKLSFVGEMPAKCAENATVFSEGNSFMISMPNCEKGFTKVAGEQTAAVSDVLGTIRLVDNSGTVKIRHMERGDAADKERIKDEDLKDSRGKTFIVVSEEDRRAELASMERAAHAEKQKKEMEALTKKLDILCKKGDYIGLGDQIEKSAALLGDVTDLLEKIDVSQKAKFKKDLLAAKDIEEAKKIYDDYTSRALEKGWDEKFLNMAYVDKRFELIDDLRSDKENKSSAIAKELKAWKKELALIDRKIYKERMKDIAVAYGDLFARELDAGRIPEALTYAEKAKELSSASDALKFDMKVAGVYNQKFKECVDKGPWKAEACEAKFANKGQGYADNAKNSLAARAQKGDEQAQEEFAAFMSEYTQTYGAGMSYNYPGFGRVTEAPGAIQQYKSSKMMEYQQQQYQAQYQQMLMGGQQQQPMFGGNNFFGGGQQFPVR